MPHDNIIQNIIPHLAAAWGYLRLGFVVIGLGLLIWSLWQMAVKSPNHGQGRVWAALTIGILFINIPGFLDTMAQTVIGQNSVQALSYQPPSNPAQAYVRFTVFVAAIVGLLGLGRGLWLLKDSTQDKGHLARGLVHIIGGIFCINLVETIRLIAQALGGSLPEVVRTIFG
jgi:hypothetical protein